MIFIDIQDNVIVKGMGKLSMPVVPGNLISLPNFLGMHSVLKTGQNWILFQLTGDQGFCCVASISFLNTVSSLLH